MGKHKKIKDPVWERKKNAIMQNYRKMLKHKQKGLNVAKNKQRTDEQFSQHGKKTFFDRAMGEYERRKAAKNRIKEIKEAKQKDREAALRRYADKKRENFKKLSRRTKWGQPVMSGRMEILLEKIQKSCTSDSIK